MLRMISERTELTETTWFLVHEKIGSKGSVYSFPCSNTGDLIDAKDEADLGILVARKIVDPVGRVVARNRRVVFSAQGICECGRVITLGGFTNICECGRMFNSAGQELAPIQFWGEETREKPQDILNSQDLDDEWED